MHLCIMLYTYRTPLVVVFIDSKLPKRLSRAKSGLTDEGLNLKLTIRDLNLRFTNKEFNIRFTYTCKELNLKYPNEELNVYK